MPFRAKKRKCAGCRKYVPLHAIFESSIKGRKMMNRIRGKLRLTLRLLIVGITLNFQFTTVKCMAQQRAMTVAELFDLVEENSSSLQAAKSEVEVAEHSVSAAKSARLPDINASLSLSYIGNVLKTDRDFSNAVGFSSPHFGNAFTLEAGQPVYSGGALTAGVRLAETNKDMANNGVEATRDAQRFNALTAYLQLLKADNEIRVYNENIALTERLIEDIRAKHEQGMALKNDITRYELQKQTLILALRKVQDNRNTMNHRLCNLLGINMETEIMPDTTLNDHAPHGNEAEWQMRANANSTTLMQSTLSTDIAKHQLKLARAAQLPKVSIFAMDNFSGPYTYDIPPIDNNFNVWTVGVAVSYSLSSLYKDNKSIRRAKAELRESKETLADTEESVDNAVNEAYTLYMQAFEQLRTRQKSAQLARENYEVINDRYLNDLALITDMTDASNIRLSAELDETNARIDIVFAYYRLLCIVGEI